MSDVLIRGVKMPKNCQKCPFMTNCSACEGYDDSCILVEDAPRYAFRREAPDSIPDYCPIHALPDGHGPLIDAAKLMRHYAWWGDGDAQRELFDAIIDQQEIVVPAEKEDV